jgi:hypothetical protein
VQETKDSKASELRDLLALLQLQFEWSVHHSLFSNP